MLKIKDIGEGVYREKLLGTGEEREIEIKKRRKETK